MSILKHKTSNKLTPVLLVVLLLVQIISGVLFAPSISINPFEIKVNEVQAAGESWYDASWTKRKAITVTENSGADLTNYQVKITVLYDSDMQADFDDIRFTDENGSDLIDHWLESKTDSTTADFWVEIPTLTASSSKTIYMYYGNGSATWDNSVGGDATFIFFDDFESYDVGTTIPNWTEVDGEWEIGIPAGKTKAVRITSSVDDALLIRDANYSGPRVTEADILDEDFSTPDPYPGIIAGYTNLSTYTAIFWESNVLSLHSWGVGGKTITTSLSGASANNYYKMSVAVNGSGIINNTSFLNYDADPGVSSIPANGVGLWMYLPTGWTEAGWIDNFRVRNYASTEPTVGTLGSEEYLDHLTITGSSTQTAGALQVIAITAKTNLGNTYQGYTGDKSITFSGANASPNSTIPTCSDKDSNDVDLETPTTLTFTNGIATCNLKLYKTETAEIEGTDGTYITTGNASYDLDIIVSSATLNNFLIDAPDSGTSGTPFSATITSRDAYNNTTTTVSGDTTLTVNQSGTITPNTIVDTEFTDDGVYTDNLTISNTEENKSVVITATNGLSTGTDTITLTGISAAPTSAVLSNITTSSMSLSWTDNSSNETGFKIEKSTDGTSYTQIGTVSASITTYAGSGITSLDSYTTYYFRVRACNTAGNSSYSTTNDATLSSGGGFISPTPPIIPISPNQTFEITITNNQSTINLSNIQNAYQIAISITPDFKYVSWEPYQENITLPNTEKVYLKFRSSSGGVSEIYEVETDLETDDIFDLSNGSLVRAINNYKVYIINNNNYKRHILNGKIFNFYNHLNWNAIQEVTSSQINSYQESYLIRELNDYKVYEIINKKKHWLDISVEEFENKYSWDEIYIINKEELGWYGI